MLTTTTTTLHSTTLDYTTLNKSTVRKIKYKYDYKIANKKQYTTPHFTNYNYSYNYVTLHPIPLDYTTLPYIALHCTHYTIANATALNTHT